MSVDIPGDWHPNPCADIPAPLSPLRGVGTNMMSIDTLAGWPEHGPGSLHLDEHGTSPYHLFMNPAYTEGDRVLGYNVYRLLAGVDYPDIDPDFQPGQSIWKPLPPDIRYIVPVSFAHEQQKFHAPVEQIDDTCDRLLKAMEEDERGIQPPPNGYVPHGSSGGGLYWYLTYVWFLLRVFLHWCWLYLTFWRRP